MPKGGKSSLVPVRAGLRRDLDYFLRAFLKIDSNKYSDFKELFANMGMTSLFNGRSYYAEIIEFNECLLSMCLRYLNENISTDVIRCFKERLFGIYALHTFYYLQQADHVVKIPMDPDVCQAFCQLSKLLKETGHMDAYACTMQLVDDKAIKIHAFINNFDPSCYKNFDTDENLENVKVYANVQMPMANLRSLLMSDVFVKMSVCHQEYNKLKMWSGLKSNDNDVNPVDEIWRTVRKYEKESEKTSFVKMKSTLDKDVSDNVTSSYGRSRMAIKESAYKAELVFTRNRRYRNANNVTLPTNSFQFDDNEQRKPTVFTPNLDDQNNNRKEAIASSNALLFDDSADEPVYVKTVTKKRPKRTQPIVKNTPKQPAEKKPTLPNKKKSANVPKAKAGKEIEVKVEAPDEYTTEPITSILDTVERKPKGRQTKNSLSSTYYMESLIQEKETKVSKNRRSVKFDMNLKILEIPNRESEMDQIEEMEEQVVHVEKIEMEDVEEIRVENENDGKCCDNEVKIELEEENEQHLTDEKEEKIEVPEKEKSPDMSPEWNEEPPTDVGDDIGFEDLDEVEPRNFENNEYINDYFLPFENENENEPEERPSPEEAELAIDE